MQWRTLREILGGGGGGGGGGFLNMYAFGVLALFNYFNYHNSNLLELEAKNQITRLRLVILICTLIIYVVTISVLFSDNSGLQLCPYCKIELDTNVHKFCYGCGKNVQEMVANVHKNQGNYF